MSELMILAAQPEVWAALVTLIVMEVVLGIDNLLFIAIVTNKLPEANRARARRLGISGALVLRLVLLSLIAWIVQLDEPIVALMGNEFSWKDIILIAGGFFLLFKATKEIHHYVDPEPEGDLLTGRVAMTLGGAIVQVLLLDLVFSVDSILTAVGMTPHIQIMVIAVVVAVALMAVAAKPLSEFVGRNPTVVMLALGFLLMIGMMLIAEGFGAHVPKGYMYSSMGFAALIEGANMMARARRDRLRDKSE